MTRPNLFIYEKRIIILILFTIITVLNTCKKLEKEMMVTTGAVSNISPNSVEVAGEIVDIGTGVSQYGHCYGKQSNVSINNSKTQLGIPSDTQNFVSVLTNLDPGEVYYIKAYITGNQKTVYGKEISFTTFTQRGTLPDINGNEYNTIVIGTQTWLKENLKTTIFTDGTSIPLVTDAVAWNNLKTSGYCCYENDASTYESIYGKLYNWYTVKTGKLCPAGWHVPTDSEWSILANYLGGESVAGGKLKEAGTLHWERPNTGATNESGFTALPGGIRYLDGRFFNIGFEGFWWSASIYYANYAWCCGLDKDFKYVNINTCDMKDGFSVRCIKD